MLGLTVSCARCHDHKFDPIPTTDYYALAGIFTSTDNCAGVRNKMGGGGLDYYDPAMLVRLSGDAAARRPRSRSSEAEGRGRRGEEGVGRDPRHARGADARARTASRRSGRSASKYERLQARTARPDRPGRRAGYAVHGVRDAKAVGDTEVRVRGEAEKLGPTVPRGFLTAFDGPRRRRR